MLLAFPFLKPRPPVAGPLPDARSAIVMPSHAPVLPPHVRALRESLRAAAVTRAGVLPLGDHRLDSCLPSDGTRRGLPLGAVHEVGTEGIHVEFGALPAGFVAALLARLPSPAPILWAAARGDMYAPGLLAYGLDPGRLVMVRPRGDADTLAVMETAVREGGFAAVVGEAGAFERTESRRLMLACQRQGTTAFVLRRWPHGRKGQDQPTAAATRWRLAPAPSDRATPPRGRAEPGTACWHAALTHARGGRLGEWLLQASMTQERDDGSPHPFRVVAELAGHTAEPRQRRYG